MPARLGRRRRPRLGERAARARRSGSSSSTACRCCHGFRWRGWARPIRAPLIGPVAVGSAGDRSSAAARRARARAGRCRRRSSQRRRRTSTTAPSARSCACAQRVAGAARGRRGAARADRRPGARAVGRSATRGSRRASAPATPRSLGDATLEIVDGAGTGRGSTSRRSARGSSPTWRASRRRERRARGRASSRRSAPPRTCCSTRQRRPRRPGATAPSCSTRAGFGAVEQRLVRRPPHARPTACCSRRSARWSASALAGALAAVAAAALFARIADARWGRARAAWPRLWFAAGAVGDAAHRAPDVRARRRGRAGARCSRCSAGARPLAAGLAALTALASPVAGAVPRAGRQLALGAWRRARPRARAAAGARASRPPRWCRRVALAALFPEGGTEPFVRSAFWPALARDRARRRRAARARARAARRRAPLRAGLRRWPSLLATPLGGNVTRLGALLAGPLVVGAPSPGAAAPAVLAALALPLAYWQLYPAGPRRRPRVRRPVGRRAAYHAPLRALPASAGPRRAFRVEIPFTENHWEAAHVAPHVAAGPRLGAPARPPLRRALLRGASSTPRRYRAWLDEHAVRYVALPDAPLDYAARAEARLIAARPALPARRSGATRTGASTRSATPAPLAEGAAGTASRSPPTASRWTRAARGDALVRVRHTPLVARHRRSRLRRARDPAG